MSSRSTTPKENTSDLSVSFPLCAYSGAMYLWIEQCDWYSETQTTPSKTC